MRMWFLIALAACKPDPSVGCVGLDLDQDGVCDRLNADFSEGATIPVGGRPNIFGLDAADLNEITELGYRYTLDYPVAVSGVLIPYRPLVQFFDPNNVDSAPLRSAMEATVGFNSMAGLYDDVGLLPYDDTPGTEPWVQAIPPDLVDSTRMGVTVVDTPQGEGLTFSCAACHTGRFMGRSIRGLTNRLPLANAFFSFGKDLLPSIPPSIFQQVTHATDAEMQMLERTKTNLRRVGLREPAQLGLDTSLAQVALSLARRGDGRDAERSPTRETTPLPNPLQATTADSKPMPFWTLRYKNQWLSDGAIVQGNPVLTNFLWNEIGRGIDLPELASWLEEDAAAIDALTVAVFNSTPPRWTEFFPPSSIDLQAAKRGQQLFEGTCAGCHGTYHKAWDTADATTLSAADLLATVEVDYDAGLGAIDVGTDPQRADAIEHFGPRLNDLAISQQMQTVVRSRDGYVPPPLDGIFVRYPYLHNNSVPSLCELLLPASERSTMFYQGPSEVPEDFDSDCVGYPVGSAVPTSWDLEATQVTAQGPGLSNQGHDAWLSQADGTPTFTADERNDLILFLKTL